MSRFHNPLRTGYVVDCSKCGTRHGSLLACPKPTAPAPCAWCANGYPLTGDGRHPYPLASSNGGTGFASCATPPAPPQGQEPQ